MNTEQLITKTLVEQAECLSPDERDVRAAVFARVHKRRRPNIGVLAPLYAGVVVIALIAVAIITVGHSRTGGRPTRAEGANAPLTTVIGAGWLPGSKNRQVIATFTAAGQRVQYAWNYAGTPFNAIVSASQTPSVPRSDQVGTEHAVTVAGKPAREWASYGGYLLAYRADNGQYIWITVVTMNVVRIARKASLAAIGRHIARTLRFDVPVTGGPAQLTTLPRGAYLTSLSYTAVAGGFIDSVDVRLGARTGDASGRPAELRYGPLHVKGDAGRPVQGHRTIVQSTGGATALTVVNLRGVYSVQLRSGLGMPDLTALYQVADGFRLTS